MTGAALFGPRSELQFSASKSFRFDDPAVWRRAEKRELRAFNNPPLSGGERRECTPRLWPDHGGTGPREQRHPSLKAMGGRFDFDEHRCSGAHFIC